MSDDPGDTLCAVFETHLDRMDGDEPPRTNYVVEAVFDADGAESPNVQYRWGMLNVAGLSSVQKAACMDLVEERDLLLRGEGDNYVTVDGVSTESPAELVALVERVLDSVYDRSLDDVAEFREREL